MSHLAFPIVWAVGLLVFAAIIAARARLLLAARPAARIDRIPRAPGAMVVDGLGQRKFLSGEQPAGIMHALIFWGFVVLMLQVVTLFGRAFDAAWDIPGFGAHQLLGPAVLRRARPARGDRDRRRGLHALPAADRPHAAPVRQAPRRAALSRDPPLGGRPDPLLHPVHHGRRAAVRRRPPRRQRHPRQRARLRAAGRTGGRGARRPEPFLRADRQRGRAGGCTA